MKKFFKYGNKGFTLIELLVVIAILGTLAAVVILNVTKYMNKGQDEAHATELANVQTAVAAYMYDHTGARPSGPLTHGTRGGDVSPFMLSNLNCDYTIDGVTGAVAQTAGTCVK